MQTKQGLREGVQEVHRTRAARCWGPRGWM